MLKIENGESNELGSLTIKVQIWEANDQTEQSQLSKFAIGKTRVAPNLSFKAKSATA